MRPHPLRAIALLLCLALPLGACGGDIVVNVYENAGEGGANSGGAELIGSGGTGAGPVIIPIASGGGLMDPTPKLNGEYAGPRTYSYKAPAAEAKPKRGGTATAGLLGDIDTFNPFLSSSASASEVHDQIFPRLMYEQPDYYQGVPTFTPQIAESWTISEDNKSIRFTLREGVVWSDGTPITGADVHFSWQAAKDPDVGWSGASIVDHIADVVIHSKREFTVEYTKSTPYNIMDINDVQIVPKHTFGRVPFKQWSNYAGWPDLATEAAGGPWVMHKHDAGQTVELHRNPRFWDKGKPYLEKLIFKIFAGQQTMQLALEAGELDILSSIQPEKATIVKKHKDLDLLTYVARTYGYMGWNCKRPPFNDKRVRNAMTLAIDREDIVESLFEGYATVAAPFIIRSMWAADRTQEPLPFDPDEAGDLLDAAGWRMGPDGVRINDAGKEFAFTLITNQGNPVRKSICEYTQANLKAIGVKVEISLIDFNQMSSKLKTHAFEAYVGGWNIATKIDPKSTWHSSAAMGRNNYVNYHHPEMDAWIDKGRVMDITRPAIRAEAMAIWKKFQDDLHENQPYTMVYEPRGLVGVNKRMQNVRVTSLRWLDNVQDWWVE